MIFIKESKFEQRQRFELNDISNGRLSDANIDDPEEETTDLTILEVFILVVKTCLNKQFPDMSLTQLR